MVLPETGETVADAAGCSTPPARWPRAASDAGTGAGSAAQAGPGHGGRIIAASTLFPDAPLPWIDLSTGISPFPYPFTPPPADAFTRLPEPEQETALRGIAAAAYGAADADRVCLGPGSQMLISLLPLLLNCRRAVILSPAYAGHERSWSRAGVETVQVADVEELLRYAGPETALVLCNPNNPDGRRTDADALLRLSRRCDLRGGWLVVDEAYADLEPAPVLAATLLQKAERFVVLRSFGKGYGLAGLRLGFLVGPRRVAGAMADLLGPWPVSGPALSIGAEALADGNWRAAAADRAVAAAARLDAVLRRSGISTVGGTALFRLAGVGDADRLWQALARRGVLARRFQGWPGRLRFGLPGCEEEWWRLAAALSCDLG